MLLDEISQLKRENELLERSIVNKDSELLDIHKQFETSSAAARTADNRIRLLESQVIAHHAAPRNGIAIVVKMSRTHTSAMLL